MNESHVASRKSLSLTASLHALGALRLPHDRLLIHTFSMLASDHKRTGSTDGVVDLDLTTETTPTAETSSSLDDLLSPTTPGRTLDSSLETDANKRDSVVDSGVVVDMDDDVRFSNVPLSAKESRKSLASSFLDRRSTVSFGKDERQSVASNTKAHRKSASAHTIGSSPRASEQFLLHRLDQQKSMADASDLKRLSVNGQQRLREEFTKLQNGQAINPPQADSSSDDNESAIDWGACLVAHWLGRE